MDAAQNDPEEGVDSAGRRGYIPLMHETKIHLNDYLHRSAKVLAAERGMSLKGFIAGLVVASVAKKVEQAKLLHEHAERRKATL